MAGGACVGGFVRVVCCCVALFAIGCSRSDDAGEPANTGGSATSGSGGKAGADAGAMSTSGAGGAGTTGGAGATGGAAGTSAGSSGASGASAGSAGEPGSGSCEVGGISYENGTSDIPAADSCNTCRCDDGTLACTRIACPPPQEDVPCAVVRRYDQCCAPWAAVKREELTNNPCLVEQGARTPAQGLLPQGCPPPNCTAVLCAEPPPEPPSRVATPTGVENACLFSDECHAQASCVLASDVRRCCACPESMPKSLVDSEPCITQVGESALGCTEVCDSDIACGACEEPPAPTCNVRDSWSLCR